MEIILIVTLIFGCFIKFGCSATCEPVRVSMCQGMPWNMTRMPNLLHHSTQENAILAIEQTEVLVKTGCSKDLLFFLCAMYSPICTMEFQQEAIPPCKGVCERARSGCEHLVINANRTWPDVLACDELPTYDKGVCISPEAIVSSNATKKQNDRGVLFKDNDKCYCKRSQRPRRKTYVSKGYSFAFKGTLLFENDDFSGNIVTTVNVLDVIHQPKVVRLKAGKTIDLWTRGQCACPKIKKGKNKEYLITGYEDRTNKRLLFNEDSIAVKWKKNWPRLLKKWENRNKRSSDKRRSKKGHLNVDLTTLQPVPEPLPLDTSEAAKQTPNVKSNRRKTGKNKRKGSANTRRQKSTSLHSTA